MSQNVKRCNFAIRNKNQSLQMNKYDIPVLLLTGYLGSGKALQNGCICCTLKMDLVQQLHDIIAMKRFDYIVIEASGVCEPAPIAQTICSIPSMAPEVIKNYAPNTPMSDCYSFAVIAYELLAMNHPLIGDMVTDGEPEMEEKAVGGELPWVEDSKDDSNQRSTGFPSDFFITAPIQKLFHRTFEEGLNDPMRRPSIGEWVDALNDGLNELLLCKTCNTYYPYKNNHKCPFSVSNSSATVIRISPSSDLATYWQVLGSYFILTRMLRVMVLSKMRFI